MNPLPCLCKSYSYGLYEVTGGWEAVSGVKIYLPFKSEDIAKYATSFNGTPSYGHVNNALLASMRSLEAVEAVSGVKIYFPAFKSEEIVKYTTNFTGPLLPM